jgi:MoaA/NifB/PqqE/SkfB family radical SAM enzyme
MKNNIILDGHKLLWHKSRLKSFLSGKPVAPITIDCALTQKCQYNCVYCYGKVQHNKGYDLSFETIKKFLRDAAEIGVKAVSFVSDGESTLHPQIYEIINFGKNCGLDIALGTNGFALKDEKLGEILKDLTYIRFNISAGAPKRYAEIHGVSESAFHKVINTIKKCVEIKRAGNLPVTIGLQMVLLPEFKNDIMPLAELGKTLRADYLVIKHCSDDEHGALGVDYSGYAPLEDTLKQAESLSTDSYTVKVKWSKILSGGKRCYTKCYGAPLMLQMSGSGLVAPCGFLFNDKYKDKFHIGNIAEKSFKEIFESAKYREVMNYISSDKFNAQCDCGTLCLQHKINEFLWNIKQNNIDIDTLETPEHKPMHVNFI